MHFNNANFLANFLIQQAATENKGVFANATTGCAARKKTKLVLCEQHEIANFGDWHSWTIRLRNVWKDTERTGWTKEMDCNCCCFRAIAERSESVVSVIPAWWGGNKKNSRELVDLKPLQSRWRMLKCNRMEWVVAMCLRSLLPPTSDAFKHVKLRMS